MHFNHIRKWLKSHWILICLCGSVGKGHLHVNDRDTFLKSNETNVGSIPEVSIFFLLILSVVCFSILFLFMCFRDTKYSGFI